MKNKIIYTLLLPLSTVISATAMAELSKKELAQEVAHCYVANQRGSTELFKSGEAENMRDVIADLVGSENINKTILIASRIQASNTIGGNGLNHMAIEKYCRPLDEMLIGTQQ